MTDQIAMITQIVKKFSNKNVEPGPEESLFESGLLDSFSLPDMVGALEQEFGIAIPDSDLEPRRFDNISRIASYVASRM
jgi:acyl carrier protein